MFHKTVLPNGLRIFTCSMPHTRSVTVALFIGAGSRYEPPEQAGIFHFIEHLLFKGTARRPSARAISEAIEGVGGIMNGGTSQELTDYWVKVARPHFDLALDLLADSLRNSLFDPAEVEKERRVILEELASINDHPDSRVDLLIDEVLWPNHPLGRDVGGTRETIQTISRDMLLTFLERQYRPSNAVVCVAGDISHEEVVMEVTRHLGDWPDGTSLTWLPAQNGHSGPNVKLESRKTDQAHLALAVHGYPAEHPDRYALDLLSVVLGEGMSSRLFQEIRERRGLAYDVHSSVSHFRDCGAVTIYSGVDPAKAPEVVTLILSQLEQLHDGVPEEELTRAKNMTRGRLFLRMEDTRSVAFWVGVQAMLLDRVLTVDEVTQQVDAVTSEAVRRVAKELLQPQRVNLAVVGPYRSPRRFANLLTARGAGGLPIASPDHPATPSLASSGKL
ncbi:MAG: insulinase family protein [Chloroflexi bacterium]|nr:insulinase family protein [Chloroflexota bacterium]